jgi:CHAT domain-containing protein
MDYREGYKLLNQITSIFTPNLIFQSMTKRLLVFLTILLFFGFTDENRSLIEQQYNALTPNLKTEPLKVLATLENLYKKAEKSLDSRDTLLANLQASLAKVYCDKNVNLAEGIRLYQKALDIRREKLPFGSAKIGITAGNLAGASRQIGLFEQGRSYAQLAIESKQAAAKVDTFSLIKSYSELSVNNRFLGNYADALTIADKTFELATAVHDSVFVANSRMTAGSVYFSTQKYAEAAVQYQTALIMYNAIIKNRLSTDPSVYLVKKDRAGTLSNLGVTFRHLKKQGESLSFLNQSLEAFQNLFALTRDPTLNIAIGNNFFERAQTQDMAGVKMNVLADFEAAIATFGHSNSPFAVECFKTYGNYLKKMGQLDAALIMYNRGIGAAFPNFSQNNVLQNPNIDDTAFPELLDIFAAKAFVLKEKNEINAAYATFEKCDTLIQSLLESYQAEQSKYFLSDKALPIYENAIGLALHLNKKDAAVNFAERNKALVLLENVKDAKAKNFGEIPQNLLDEERNGRAEIAYFEKQLYEAETDSAKTNAKSLLFTAKEKLNRFNKNLESDYPKYFDLKTVKNPPLSISGIQKELDAQTAAVSYFMGDSTLFVFGFSKNNCQIFSQNIPYQYKNDFQGLRKSLNNEKYIRDSTSFAESVFCNQSHAFFKNLIEKPLAALNADNKLSRLRIVPDGFLGYLPFELLLTQPSEHWKGKNVPYLLRQYAVSYAYSLRLLNDGEGTTSAQNFGGFGIEYSDSTFENNINPSKSNSYTNIATTRSKNRSEGLARLAFADDEVKNIKNLLGGGQIWLNGDATKSAFMKNAPQCGILHLAMHGAIDENNPLNSGLIFSVSDTSKDNFLSGYDLFSMQFKTQLAVLSACNTGNGELRRSEGVMSLARAFAYAGCPSTVMSLWSIPDESTSKVMLAFYKNLKNGDPKDIALQKAKLEYLDNCPPQYSIPNQWGASVVIGNVSPIDFRAWWAKPWIWGLIVSVFGVFGFWFFRRKKINSST